MPSVTFLYLWRIISVCLLHTDVIWKPWQLHNLSTCEWILFYCYTTFILSDIWKLRNCMFLFQADVTGAYDSLPHDKLVEVILQILAPDRNTSYSIRRYAAVMRTRNGSIKKNYRTLVRETWGFLIITKKVKFFKCVRSHSATQTLCPSILMLSLQFSTLLTFSCSPNKKKIFTPILFSNFPYQKKRNKMPF